MVTKHLNKNELLFTTLNAAPKLYYICLFLKSNISILFQNIILRCQRLENDNEVHLAAVRISKSFLVA